MKTLLGFLCAAGVAVLPAAARGALPDESRVLANLLKLHGEAVSMLYTPGALDRAAHVQERLDALEHDVRDWGGFDLGLHGVVLSPEDWQALHLAVPYGLPMSMAEGLATPAWGDPHSVALWRRLLGGALPWTGDEPINGTRDEAASLALADTMLQVECGRLAAARVVTLGPDWVRELLAHVVALTAIESHEQERRGEIESVYAALAAHQPAPRPVAEFAAGAGLEQRLAYQPVFFRGARIVLDKDGRRAAKKLLRMPDKQSGTLTEGDLVKRYPELKAWLAGQ
jgi:hypothetical protein